MTEQEYHEALQKTHIQSGPNWNLRYLDALDAAGLKLVPMPEGQGQHWGYYMQAPLPVRNEPPSWGERLLIVPKDEQQ